LILISGQAVPTFAGITIILICGLCVFIAWRNHGVIDPYNWGELSDRVADLSVFFRIFCGEFVF
jgi:hypothetical protein